jgi:1-acyl-sn-glycerol-3-phosphate acyltransferase
MKQRTAPLYGWVRAWAWLLMHGFYRVRFSGEQFPVSGPLLVIANHTNGMADGGLLLLASPRPLRILVKYQLTHMPVLGAIVRGVGALPVYRQKDGVDRSKNAEAFRAVHQSLAQGQAVALFPEGSSHSEPRLGELKTGVARLALGALAAEPGAAGLRILPVALHYSARDRFRSCVQVVVGEPLQAQDFATPAGAEDREAVAHLMAALRSALEELSAALPVGLTAADLCALRWRLGSPGELDVSLARRLAARLRRRLKATGSPSERLLARLRALSPTPPSAPPWWAWMVALPWLPPALLAALLARRLRPTPDKHVTTLLLSASLLLPCWTLTLMCLVWPDLGHLGALLLLLIASAAASARAFGWSSASKA